MAILLLNATEVQQLLDPAALLDALAAGFRALSKGLVVAPNRNQVSVPDKGFLLAMPAYQQEREVTVKLVSVFHGNGEMGLPTHQALIALFDPDTGRPVALLDGTYITALRTAGAAALATRLLARENARVLAIVGSGVQGRAHLTMLPRVRPFSEIRIASRNFANAEQLAASESKAHAVPSIEEAVRGADVVCLCTNSNTPVIRSNWLMPGAHVTSVGYAPPGSELDPDIIRQGSLFVETYLAFEPPPVGCSELSGMDRSSGTELGEILLGEGHGRQAQDELTVYKSMGHACEDMAAASLVYRQAQEAGAGRSVDL